MPDDEDVVYRGFKLTPVHQGDNWVVTVWPTSVNQPLPDGGTVPSQAATREAALSQAKASIDGMPEMVDQATIDTNC